MRNRKTKKKEVIKNDVTIENDINESNDYVDIDSVTIKVNVDFGLDDI